MRAIECSARHRAKGMLASACFNNHSTSMPFNQVLPILTL